MIISKNNRDLIRKVFVTTLTLSALLLPVPAYSGKLGPGPQIIAEYDRGFIERSGAQSFGELLDTGIVRYFFTGGRNLLVMVNGRPYGTTASNLDTIPLSAVERIEVIRAESLGTVGGRAAVRGAYNLVLRTDLEGIDVRATTRMPTRDGGDTRQGSVVWGGKTESGGQLTVGLDVLSRDHIPGSAREHSRSEWTKGGEFADAKNVSPGGNTLYVYDTSEKNLRSFSLGDCDPKHGYTGPLKNPPGIGRGDDGCGYAYGNVWWDTASYDQENMIINLVQPLEADVEFQLDANFTQGRGAFRYAPSVGSYSFTPHTELLGEINNLVDPKGSFDTNDYFLISHRFTGHGTRDWKNDYDEYDVSASIVGQLSNELEYDAQISAYRNDGVIIGDTFVATNVIQAEIAAGHYDLADPLSEDEDHKKAIAKSSVREIDAYSARHLSARFAFEGIGPGIGERKSAWTAGVEFEDYRAHRLLRFRAKDGSGPDYNVTEVLGSGGTSYAGERDSSAAFGELSLPLSDSMDLRAGARIDKLDDIGTLRAWRFGTEYHANDIVTLRGSWSTGDGAPGMYYLHSEASQDHPYVQCIPSEAEQGRCPTTNWVQVKRITEGNPNLKPSDSERISIGAEVRKGANYFVADLYQLKTSDLPGLRYPTWSILNHPECDKDNPVPPCIELDKTRDVSIHDTFANLIKTEIVGLNTRFGARNETDWGFIGMRGFWRHVDSSEQFRAEQKYKFPLPRNAILFIPYVGRGDWTAEWAINYRAEIENIGSGEFPSWTGHDLTFDWKNAFGVENMRLTLGVYNVTDAKLSLNTRNVSSYDGPISAGWGRTFFATVNYRF